MTAGRMKFGVFLPPYHGRSENPSLALHRDLLAKGGAAVAGLLRDPTLAAAVLKAM